MILKGANMMNKLISYFGTFTPGADGAVGAFQFEYLTSLGFAALVIFAGRAIVRRSHVLRKFAIPAPVISGLLFSVLIAIFKGTGILAISFDTNVSQRSAKECVGSCTFPYVRFAGQELSMNVPSGRFTTRVSMVGRGDLTIGFNLRYMLDALKQFRKEPTVRIKLSGPYTPIVVEAEGRSDFALVLPVRLRDEMAA